MLDESPFSKLDVISQKYANHLKKPKAQEIILKSDLILAEYGMLQFHHPRQKVCQKMPKRKKRSKVISKNNIQNSRIDREQKFISIVEVPPKMEILNKNQSTEKGDLKQNLDIKSKSMPKNEYINENNNLHTLQNSLVHHSKETSTYYGSLSNNSNSSFFSEALSRESSKRMKNDLTFNQPEKPNQSQINNLQQLKSLSNSNQSNRQEFNNITQIHEHQKLITHHDLGKQQPKNSNVGSEQNHPPSKVQEILLKKRILKYFSFWYEKYCTLTKYNHLVYHLNSICLRKSISKWKLEIQHKTIQKMKLGEYQKSCNQIQAVHKICSFYLKKHIFKRWCFLYSLNISPKSEIPPPTEQNYPHKKPKKSKKIYKINFKSPSPLKRPSPIPPIVPDPKGEKLANRGLYIEREKKIRIIKENIKKEKKEKEKIIQEQQKKEEQERKNRLEQRNQEKEQRAIEREQEEKKIQQQIQKLIEKRQKRKEIEEKHQNNIKIFESISNNHNIHLQRQAIIRLKEVFQQRNKLYEEAPIYRQKFLLRYHFHKLQDIIVQNEKAREKDAFLFYDKQLLKKFFCAIEKYRQMLHIKEEKVHFIVSKIKYIEWKNKYLEKKRLKKYKAELFYELKLKRKVLVGLPIGIKNIKEEQKANAFREKLLSKAYHYLNSK